MAKQTQKFELIGTSSKKCFRASAPKWPLGPSLITLGKILPFFYKQQLHLSPEDLQILKILESSPLSLTTNFNHHCKFSKRPSHPQLTTSGTSRRSQPQAARIVRRQWEGPFISSGQNRDPLSFVSNNFVLDASYCYPLQMQPAPPQALWNFSLTTVPHRHLVLPSRLPATSIDAADCVSMKRILIYNSFLGPK